MKYRQFIKLLKRHGVEIIENRGKGGHVGARFRDKKNGHKNAWRERFVEQLH